MSVHPSLVLGITSHPADFMFSRKPAQLNLILNLVKNGPENKQPVFLPKARFPKQKPELDNYTARIKGLSASTEPTGHTTAVPSPAHPSLFPAELLGWTQLRTSSSVPARRGMS